jgi:hypothetical protein
VSELRPPYGTFQPEKGSEMTNIGEPWRCKACGAVLGNRVRRDENGRHVEALVTLAGPELIGFGLVPCACGEVRFWQPGEAAIEMLVKMVQKSVK